MGIYCERCGKAIGNRNPVPVMMYKNEKTGRLTDVCPDCWKIIKNKREKNKVMETFSCFFTDLFFLMEEWKLRNDPMFNLMERRRE